jgi:hypothetical protein
MHNTEGSNLSSVIMEAVVNAENIGLLKKMTHAIHINRVDVAKDELNAAFSPDSPEKPVRATPQTAFPMLLFLPK